MGYQFEFWGVLFVLILSTLFGLPSDDSLLELSQGGTPLSDGSGKGYHMSNTTKNPVVQHGWWIVDLAKCAHNSQVEQKKTWNAWIISFSEQRKLGLFSVVWLCYILGRLIDRWFSSKPVKHSAEVTLDAPSQGMTRASNNCLKPA